MKLPIEKSKKILDLGRQNVFLYGLPKVGKTTFCAQMPNTLFLATEEGHKHVEIFKVDIKKWQDVYDLAQELNKTKHEFTTLVVDIVDHFYKHCEHYICKKFNVEHPSDLAYGKGFGLVKDEFVRVVNGINQMGYGMIFLSHAKEREVKKKTITTTYMDASLGGTAGSLVAGMCDLILYAYIDETGRRLMRTKPSKYVNAGDRTGKLPEVMNFDYKELTIELTK